MNDPGITHDHDQRRDNCSIKLFDRHWQFLFSRNFVTLTATVDIEAPSLLVFLSN